MTTTKCVGIFTVDGCQTTVISRLILAKERNEYTLSELNSVTIEYKQSIKLRAICRHFDSWRGLTHR